MLMRLLLLLLLMLYRRLLMVMVVLLRLGHLMLLLMLLRLHKRYLLQLLTAIDIVVIEIVGRRLRIMIVILRRNVGPVIAMLLRRTVLLDALLHWRQLICLFFLVPWHPAKTIPMRMIAVARADTMEVIATIMLYISSLICDEERNTIQL